jgi:hypothetical protein
MAQGPVVQAGEDLVDGCVAAALACGVRPRSGSSKAAGALAATCNERA